MAIFVPLDVEYDTDDKIIEAGPLAELLYVRGLAFCKRKLNDGKIKRSQLSVIAARIPNANKHAATLVEVGLWRATQTGWSVVAWSKRNRSRADVEAQRELASEAGIRGNHDRWHVGPEGKPSPKCPLCRKERIGLPDRVRSGAASPESESESESETEPKPEPEPETRENCQSSSNNSNQSDLDPTTDDDLISQAIDLHARCEAARRASDRPDRYAETVRVNDRIEHRDALHAFIEANPSATAEQVAIGVFGVTELDLMRLKKESA